MTSTPVNPTDLIEARQIHQQTHAHIDTLLTSGVSEAAAVTGMMNALVERVMMTSGPEKAALWLRSQARQVQKDGPALVAAFQQHKLGK